MQQILSNGYIAMNVCQYLSSTDIINLYDFYKLGLPIYVLTKMDMLNICQKCSDKKVCVKCDTRLSYCRFCYKDNSIYTSTKIKCEMCWGELCVNCCEKCSNNKCRSFIICPDCFRECVLCYKKTCPECVIKCNRCRKEVCNKCWPGEGCSLCGYRPICKGCYSYCNECKEIACRDCISDDTNICRKCSDKCSVCSDKIIGWCAGCEKPLCEKHSGEIEECICFECL